MKNNFLDSLTSAKLILKLEINKIRKGVSNYWDAARKLVLLPYGPA